jgi:hypothetical protein
MTLPSISLGHAPDGLHYAEFTPEGMVDKVRLYGETVEEVTDAAFEWLAGHDFRLRQKEAEKKNGRHLETVHSIDEYAEDIRALNDYYAEIGAEDPVERPAHYTRFGVELIEITEWLNFNRGNAVKYLARAGSKHPSRELEDLKKALWYVQREIDRLQK